jgi:hypothetical protein
VSPVTRSPGGYAGKALIVDVTGPDATTLLFDDAVLRAYLGGVGLGAWLLHRLAPPRVDPCSAPAPLAFVFSPLIGTPLTTSAKFAVVAKAPLTGMLNDALASSQFAISGKLTCHDAIVLTGRAPVPSVLLVDGATPRLVAAGDTWGRPAAEAEQTLKRRLGRGWRIAAIGPAGERGVRYATISHDGRHAGRGGLGAVHAVRRTRTACWPPRLAVTSWVWTPSPPVARSPGRWSARSAGCSTRRGCVSATAPRCFGRWTRSAAATGSAPCSPRVPGAPRRWIGAVRSARQGHGNARI